MLESRTDFEVCGEAKNGKEAVLKTQELHPDVVILDLSMPVLNGLDAARIIRQTSPNIPIVFVSIYDSGQIMKEAYRIGVRGFVLKENAEPNLVQAVEAAVRNETYFPSNLK